MMPTRRFAFACSIVFFHLLGLSLAVAQTGSDNSYRLRENDTVTFASPVNFDLSSEGTVEFWVKHLFRGDAGKLRKDESVALDNSELALPCSILVAAGTEEEPKFAIYLNQPKDAAAATRLGITNSFKDLGDPEKMLSLSRDDGAGNEQPLRFVRSNFYHVAIVKPRGKELLDIYVDGVPQGSMKGTLADFTGTPLHIGWQTAPHTKGLDEDNYEVAQFVPFDGEIGGLRIWKSALPENSIYSLIKFGRSPEIHEITLIGEYSDLAAWADFRGIRWDDKAGRWSEDRIPRLRSGDPLAGRWRLSNAVVTEVESTGNYNDYPIYTFIPRDEPLNAAAGFVEYNVFEDAVYIGVMYSTDMNNAEGTFLFQHTDKGWPPISLTARREIDRSSGRKILALTGRVSGVPRPFATVSSGTIKLTRATLEQLGTPTFSTQQYKDSVERNRAAVNDPLTSVFLVSNNLRYKNVLYSGYNVPKMDGIDLFKTGVQNTEPIFKVPESDLFSLDANQIRLMPHDLGISNKNAGLTTSTSTYISNSAEYTSMLNERNGSGWNMNGSVTVGASVTAKAGFAGSGVEVSANVSATIGSAVSRSWQDDVVTEGMAMNSTGSDLIVRRSTFQHYALYQKKEAMRLSEPFRTAVLELYDRCAKASSEDARRELIYEFFDRWGTHYSFATTFGAMHWSETLMDESTIGSASEETVSNMVTLNEGKSGSETKYADKLSDTLKNAKTVARSIGGRSAGTEHSAASPDDEPNPISVDLRPIDTVLSPQHFPDMPQVYGTLRRWVAETYVRYCIHCMKDTITRLQAQIDRNKGKLRIDRTDSIWKGAEITQEDLDRYRQNLAMFVETLNWPEEDRGDLFVIRTKQFKGKPGQRFSKLAVNARFGAGIIPAEEWNAFRRQNPKPGMMGLKATTRAKQKTNLEMAAKDGTEYFAVDETLTRKVEELNKRLGEKHIWNGPITLDSSGLYVTNTSQPATAFCGLPNDASRHFVYVNLEVRGPEETGKDYSIHPTFTMVTDFSRLTENGAHNGRIQDMLYLINPKGGEWYANYQSVAAEQIKGTSNWFILPRRWNCGTTLDPNEWAPNTHYLSNGLAVSVQSRIIPNIADALTGDMLDTKRIVSSDPKWGEFRPGPKARREEQGNATRSAKINFNSPPTLASLVSQGASNQFVGDFNKDGRDELFLANGYTWKTYDFLKKRWKFIGKSSITNSQIQLGDFDGDGTADVYVNGSPGRVWRSYRRFRGDDSDWKDYTTGSNGWQYADFTGEGKVDGFYIWTFRQAPSKMWEWRVYNNLPSGSGDIVRAMNDPEYYQIIDGVKFGDFDGDGKADIFTTEGDPKTRKYVWKVMFDPFTNPGKPSTVINTSSYSSQYLVLGDFNGDKLTDVLEVYQDWGINYGGKGNQSPVKSAVTVNNASALKVGDFNGDGTDDLLRADESGLTVLFGTKGEGLVGEWIPFGQ